MSAPYRKLPGKRRGFIRMASVWAGPDHLLLVRGSRFREEYKRFYYRDVQAIAVARAPRFHVSVTVFGIAFACLVAFATAQAFMPLAPDLLAPGGHAYGSMAQGALGLTCLFLLLAWAYVSAMQSCRCRIYTAVSADELPSVYRLWTARKFLAQVQPLIAQTQGVIEGEWAAAAEERGVGPSIAKPTEAAPMDAVQAWEPEETGRPRRSLVSDLLLASLLADAVVKLAPMPAVLHTWLPFATPLLSIAGAIAVIVQHHRGRLRTGMNRIAVASLVAFGLLYYVQTLSASITAGVTAAKTGKQTIAVAFPRSKAAQEAGAVFDAILVMVGLIISLREDDNRPRGITG